MANEKALLDFFGKIEDDVTGVIATAVVDLESGMTLAAKTNRGDFDLAVASAYNSELVKQKMKIMRTLNLKSTLEDMLITLSDQFHLIKFLPGGTSFLYLAADRSGTNLAILRNSVNKQVAAPFMHRVNGRWLDFYTDTPLIGTGVELERLVDKRDRGAIYVIGSGENQEDGRSLMRAFGISEALRSPPFRLVFQGRDGVTRVWKVDAPSPPVVKGR